MRRRSLTALAIAFLLVSGMGCSGGNSGFRTHPSDELEAPLPPIISMYVSDHALEVPESAALYEDYMGRQTNVQLRITYLPHSQYLDQLNLRFASGDFPNVYQLWAGPAEDLINGGKVLPLDDLIDRYGVNMKKAVPQATWDAVTLQGKIYAIPQPTATRQGQVLFIRKDWLDRLGLDIPRTSDELLAVFRAFRDNDPNGNGLSDEIPFTMREKLEWAEPIFGMWGVAPRYTETYYQDELILGSVHPNYVTGLEFLRTMYAEGLLDREFLMNTLSTWDQKISSGVVGAWAHAPQAAWRWQQALNESIPEQHPEVIAIPAPQGEGYDGPVGTRWSPVSKTYIIMKNAADPEAIVKYFDWLYSEEGQRFTEYGIEGETYTLIDGQYVFNEARSKEIQFIQKVYAVHGLNEEAESAFLNDPQAYEKLKVAYAVANSQGFVSETIGMPSLDSDYNIHSLYIEAAALVIIGAKPPESYMEFIEMWRKSGGQKLIDERTAWYRENRLPREP